MRKFLIHGDMILMETED